MKKRVLVGFILIFGSLDCFLIAMTGKGVKVVTDALNTPVAKNALGSAINNKIMATKSSGGDSNSIHVPVTTQKAFVPDSTVPSNGYGYYNNFKFTQLSGAFKPTVTRLDQTELSTVDSSKTPESDTTSKTLQFDVRDNTSQAELSRKSITSMIFNKIFVIPAEASKPLLSKLSIQISSKFLKFANELGNQLVTIVSPNKYQDYLIDPKIFDDPQSSTQISPVSDIQTNTMSSDPLVVQSSNPPLPAVEQKNSSLVPTTNSQSLTIAKTEQLAAIKNKINTVIANLSNNDYALFEKTLQTLGTNLKDGQPIALDLGDLGIIYIDGALIKEFTKSFGQKKYNNSNILADEQGQQLAIILANDSVVQKNINDLIENISNQNIISKTPTSKYFIIRCLVSIVKAIIKTWKTPPTEQENIEINDILNTYAQEIANDKNIGIDQEKTLILQLQAMAKLIWNIRQLHSQSKSSTALVIYNQQPV